jgi:uncharacterized damage-inducible protein DinB
MTTDDIQMLFQYDRWANNKVLQAASALSEEQFIRDLRGSFCSVRDTLVHIIGGEWLWLSYWRAPFHSPEVIVELRAQRDTHIHPNRLPDFASVRLKWAEVEKEQLAFVSHVTENKASRSRHAARTRPFDATHGQPFHIPSRPDLPDDAAAQRRAGGHRLPCFFDRRGLNLLLHLRLPLLHEAEPGDRPIALYDFFTNFLSPLYAESVSIGTGAPSRAPETGACHLCGTSDASSPAQPSSSSASLTSQAAIALQ